MTDTRPKNVAQKLIRDHLVAGDLAPGEEIALEIDQTLTQDATGTLVMLELEAMGVETVATELSVQYVDHNLLQTDNKNPDDHLFLQSACRRFGVWYSRPGNGVSHPVHQQRFGRPGASLVGSDSHTPAAGAIGMLALGAGGLDVALAMAGEPLYLKMPEIFGVELTGKLADWVSAKDVVLDMLRRHGVSGARGCILEYHGPGVAELDAMDRHVIANMGTELGATTTVFPSDEETRRYLKAQGREEDWVERRADDGAAYDRTDAVDLGGVEPLIALPSSPGNVVPVREVAGRGLYQAYIGSSANPGLRDFWVPAKMVAGRTVPAHVSFDVNPTSRQLVENLASMDAFTPLIRAGARFHQTGCNGCIGMGQAPATGRNSLRTVPRNFPGRSGTEEDAVYLCSPETATASALKGEIVDPRDLAADWGMDYPAYRAPDEQIVNDVNLVPPPDDAGPAYELVKGPNVASIPELPPLADRFRVPVLIKLGDDISTDEILPAGADVLPYRSNIPKIAEWTLSVCDPGFHDRAREAHEQFDGHVVVAGENYAQGSSREHAALAPRVLGQRAVVAKGYARIGWQNLVNYGILPLEFADPADYEKVEQGDEVRAEGVRDALAAGDAPALELLRDGEVVATIATRHDLSGRQREAILAGGVINAYRKD